SFYPNALAMRETTLETTGMQADSDSGGIQINYVPKDGGNTFEGLISANFGNDATQGSNLNDTLRGRGLTTVAKLDKVYDVGGGVGGRLKRDRIWFFTAQRVWGTKEFQP